MDIENEKLPSLTPLTNLEYVSEKVNSFVHESIGNEEAKMQCIFFIFFQNKNFIFNFFKFQKSFSYLIF